MIITGFLLFLFVITCILLTVVILLQSSKGEGLASGAFGGTGMQSIFGGRGAGTFLSKLTTWLAIAFIVLALILAKFYGGSSAINPEELQKEQSQSAISETTEPLETTPEGETLEAETKTEAEGTKSEGVKEPTKTETPAEKSATPDETKGAP